MNLLERFIKLLCEYPEILNEKVLQASSVPRIPSQQFKELMTYVINHTNRGTDFQELKEQEWPEFNIPYLRAELIKCIGYSNSSSLYGVLLNSGEVRFVSYDSVIIK